MWHRRVHTKKARLLQIRPNDAGRRYREQVNIAFDLVGRASAYANTDDRGMCQWKPQSDGWEGSAIAFANSYGQIGGAVGPQLFNSRFAPHYTTSFAIAMGFVGVAIIMASITWAVTAKVDIETRRIRRVRIAAGKRNQAVLNDVDIHATEKEKIG